MLIATADRLLRPYRLQCQPLLAWPLHHQHSLYPTISLCFPGGRLCLSVQDCHLPRPRRRLQELLDVPGHCTCQVLCHCRCVDILDPSSWRRNHCKYQTEPQAWQLRSDRFDNWLGTSTGQLCVIYVYPPTLRLPRVSPEEPASKLLDLTLLPENRDIRINGMLPASNLSWTRRVLSGTRLCKIIRSPTGESYTTPSALPASAS